MKTLLHSSLLAPVLVLALVSSAGPRGCTPAPKVPPKTSGDPAAQGTLARPAITPARGEGAKPVELAFPDEKFRGTQPAAGTIKDLAQPGVERFALANGVEVYLVERHELPTVSMQLVMQGGEIDDPKGKEGMASLCVGLMGDGTVKLDKIAFSEALADLASSVGTGAGLDEQSVTLSALTRNLDPTLDLWADTLLSPGFRPDEFERAVKRRLDGLKQTKGSPDGVASRVTNSIAYGETHPFGSIVTEGSTKEIALDDCRAHVRDYFKPKGAMLFVVGDVSKAQIEEKIGARLKAWTGAPKKRAPVGPAKPRSGRIFFVDVPGAPQSVVRVLHGGPKRTAADFIPTSIMSTILGGGFSSRINMNIRESKGYAYGAGGGFSYTRIGSLYFAGGSIRSDATADSVKEILGELKRIKQEDVSEVELSREIEGAVLSLPANWATGGQVLGSYRGLVYFGLPLDWYKSYVAKVQAVKIPDVRKSAATHLKPDQAQIVVVGDAKTVLPTLEALLKSEGGKGKLVVLDADGKTVR